MPFVGDYPLATSDGNETYLGVSAGGLTKRYAKTIVREKLAADRTYYVRTDGNNANNGIADTTGGAWATLQYAILWIIDNIDINGKIVKIQLNDGTHAGAAVLDTMAFGGGWIWIHGNDTTPTNVIIEGGSGCGLETRVGGSTGFYIGAVQIQASGYAPIVSWKNHIRLGNPDYTGVVHFGPSVSWAFCLYAMGIGAFIEDNVGHCIVTYGAMGGLIQATDGGKVTMYYPHLAAGTTWGTAAVEAWGDSTSVVLYTHEATRANATGAKYSVNDYKIIGEAGEKFPGTLPGVASHLLKEKLNADRTYYVRTDGNNINNGLANTTGGAWATIQRAFDYISENININNKTITIQLQTGVTHAGANSINRFIEGKGVVVIKGSAVNNTDTIISNASDNGLNIGGNPLITWYIGGVKIESSYYLPLYIRNVGVQLGDPGGTVPAPRFGSPGLTFAALIQLDGPLASCSTYSAGITIDVGAVNPGYFVQAVKGANFSSGPVAFAATTTFNNAFVEATDNSVITVNTADAVSGSAVGKRYNVTTGGQVKRTSGTGGIDNIPGTVAGTWTAAMKSFTATSIALAGDLIWKPSASITLANNGELTVEATSNTTVTIKLRGSDGVTRSTTLTLS